MQNFMDTYIAPYMHLTNCRSYPMNYMSGARACAMRDGSGIVLGYVDGLDIYYVTDFNLLLKAKQQGKDFRKDMRHSFAFSMQKVYADGTMGEANKNINSYNKHFVSPYMLNWDGTREDLFNSSRYGCSKNSTYSSFCTKLVQDNNWEFPPDYPW